ncbi:hypothetical protein PLEOSDRAFT_1101917 [Pleurotus ostreatus PC15]|uniref:Riboflavin kinase n=1 Tax=Pleurotus ostreatus (strain PC15) TaxID=1137138 RepID=A0A067P4Y2_PLEO1|nr:hypothetical protein PLEOSDRAFT_1101917 [Pleurotus ostreatus PC15]
MDCRLREVYYGRASPRLPPSHPNQPTASSGTFETRSGFREYPMVMSIRYILFYKNTARSAEVRSLHAFGDDPYGVKMPMLIAGFVRNEKKDYPKLDALVEDIRVVCNVARRSFDREA